MSSLKIPSHGEAEKVGVFKLFCARRVDTKSRENVAQHFSQCFCLQCEYTSKHAWILEAQYHDNVNQLEQIFIM